MNKYIKPATEAIEIGNIPLMAESPQSSISQDGKVKFSEEQEDYEETENTWNEAF